MNSRERKTGQKDSGQESAGKVIRSMIVSLILVALTFLYMFGFRVFLKHRTYTGNADYRVQNEDDGDILQLEEPFDVTHILIRNLSDKEEFYITKEPGIVDDDSVLLENGQIVEVKQKGLYKDKSYYRLKDERYVQAKASRIQELKEYLPLEGYIAITYISSGGVRLRSWVDFEADNVVKSVYVGDRVDIEAMVTTTDDVKAFRTTEGLYITTNTQYFKDYTNLSELKETAEATTDTGSAPEDTGSGSGE